MTTYSVGDTVRVLEVASTGLWGDREGTYVLGGDDGEDYPHTVNIPGVGAIGFRDEEIELVRRALIPEPEVPVVPPHPVIEGVPTVPGVYIDKNEDTWALLENGGQWYATWPAFPWQAMAPTSADGPFTPLYAHLKGLEA